MIFCYNFTCFHLYMEMFWLQEQTCKFIKIKHQLGMEQGSDTRGHLVGSTNPTNARPSPTKCHLINPCQAKETNSQAHSIVVCMSIDQSMLQDEITWILGPTITMSMLKWTRSFIRTHHCYVDPCTSRATM